MTAVLHLHLVLRILLVFLLVKKSLKTGPDAEDDVIPGMNNLENSEGSDSNGPVYDIPAEKTE